MRKIVMTAAAVVAVLIPAQPAWATPKSLQSKGGPPPACVTALNDYQQLVGYFTQFVSVARGYEQEIAPAAKAGQAQSAAGITAISNKMTALNNQVTGLNTEIETLRPKLEAAAAACKK